MTRLIPLTQGKVTIVDDEDYERLSMHKWCFRNDGYACRTCHGAGENKTILMHRIIANAPPGTDVDHINGDRLYNRRCNIRFATHSQNAANQSHDKANCSSRYKGVYWDKKARKWMTYIRQDYKRHFLGYYDNEKDAARAYNVAALQRFGEFARPNPDID